MASKPNHPFELFLVSFDGIHYDYLRLPLEFFWFHFSAFDVTALLNCYHGALYWQFCMPLVACDPR
ncbi:unnamed protein product, partial [Nesidiocoris tenuis]